MIKGVSKRVVVVKSPDTKLFEEAIFLVRDDAAHKGVTKEDLLKEASRVAGVSLDRAKHDRLEKLRRAAPPALAGAAATGALWLISSIL